MGGMGGDGRDGRDGRVAGEGLEEGFGYGVGHEFASAGEDDAVLVVFEEAEGEEFGDGVGPRGEVGGVDAVVGADGEGEDFGGAG